MKLAGILTMLLGIALALFVGFYIMLFGGIEQLGNGIFAHDGSAIAMGVIRVAFFWLSIILIGGISWFFGSFLIDEAKRRKRRQRALQKQQRRRGPHRRIDDK